MQSREITPSENLRGILLMVLAMAGFAINDGFIKTLAGSMGIGQVLLLRGAIAAVLIYAIAVWKKQMVPISTAWRPILVLRSIFEVLATLSFITALFNLPIANVSAILQALPLVVTIGAAVFFKDAIGWRRLSAILVGLVGVLLIVRPGSADFNIYYLSCIVTVFAAAGRDLTSTRLEKDIPSLFVTLQTAIVVSAAGGVICLFSEWEPVSSNDLLVLTGASIFLIMGYFGIVATMRVGEVAVIAPFRYTVLLFSILIGMVVFSEYPDLLTWVGSAIIVATGIYTLVRERKLRMKRTRFVRG